MINPEAHAVHALKAMFFKGARLTTVLGALFFLSVFTAIMLVLAVATFQRAEEDGMMEHGRMDAWLLQREAPKHGNGVIAHVCCTEPLRRLV
ncbi:MAG: ABC transporter permease [Thermodesulfobacteriota bacterium]